ncbi:TraR/DksA family transcriptional regulator [Pollutimonas bauzanensis]|uniref:Transcriptional regulator, TraR/DksA family n=1 Tax=Pollutimonas bauzanensis TaxID=658167 RepID=A0A1M5MNY1_9BURK|nr:TraR/DksA C4-type zinc finger protein [Pollutimonas bauzanensis]SHG78956.1 transcriptional regulator, TraR/DksA family [Pollutimonas bauzanensis]
MKHLSTDDIRLLHQRLAVMKSQALDDLREADADIKAGFEAQNLDVGSRSDDAEILRFEAIRRTEMEIDGGLLQGIEAAEQRMRDGCYGTCVDCGKPIARERLLAQPAAARCTACASRKELASAAPGGGHGYRP